MPGYKIFFRILLVLVILGGIGYGIFYLVTLGNDRLSTFNIYNEMTNSDANQSLNESMSSDDTFVIFANSNDSEFADIYSYYNAQKLVLGEMAYNLYFAGNNSEEKVDVESALREYETAMKETNSKVELFLDRKAYFESASSIEGITLSASEIDQLKEIEILARGKLLLQTEELDELNGLLYPFIVENCLGGNISGSLKYSMIDAIYYQSNLLGNCLESDTVVTSELNDAVADNDRAVALYKLEKSDNFIQQGVVDSVEANFVLGYNSMTSNVKVNFFNAYDKELFIESQSPAVLENLQYVVNFFDWWGVAK